MSNETRYLYEFGPFRLDPAERLLLREGQPVPLPPKAFLTLVLLVERSGRVRDKQELMRAVWPETFVEENNLTQCVSILRKALGDNGNGQRFIETVPRLGYRFAGDVRRLPISVETNGFPSLQHSAQAIVREHENAEKENLAETATAPAAIGQGPPEAAYSSPHRQKIFLARHRRFITIGLLCLCLAGASYWLLRPAERPRVLNYALLSSNEGYMVPLFSDGASLFLNAPLGRLARLSLVSGEITFLEPQVSGLSLEMRDFSRAHQEILATGGEPITGERQLWVMRLPDGGLTRLGSLYGHDAVWSPDGEAIIYAYENSLYTAQRDGSRSHLLVRLPGAAWNPRWSPDGKWLRFILRQADTESLWEVSGDGSNPHSLLGDGVKGIYPGEWLPNGRYFILPLNRNGQSDLWILPRTDYLHPHPEPVRLTSGPLDFQSPVLSKDGKRIFAVAKLLRVAILRHDRTSNSFVSFLPGISADGLAFSADGQWVAYSSFPDRTLWRSRVDGSERLQLTFAPMESVMPRWSPDGRTIAFMGRSSGKIWNLQTIPMQGGSPEPLVPSPDDQANPTWSPDGNSLAYAGAPWQTGFAASSTAVHLFDLRTHAATTLPDSTGLWSPRWSPDGQYLVAETIDSQGLRLFDFRTRRWTPLATVSGAVLGYTAWSHDSRYVYFNAGLEKNNHLYRVNVEGPHRVALVLDLNEVSPGYTLGQWFTLAPDDSPMVLRDTGASNIYALDVRLP